MDERLLQDRHTVEELLSSDETSVVVEHDGDELVNPDPSDIMVSNPTVRNLQGYARELKFKVSIYLDPKKRA